MATAVWRAGDSRNLTTSVVVTKLYRNGNCYWLTVVCPGGVRTGTVPGVAV